MSDPVRSRSAPRPLPDRRFAARGNALATEIASFEDRSLSARARTVAGMPGGRGSVRRMAACDSQIAYLDDRELSHATRRSRAVCRRGIVHGQAGIVHGKGWFPGRDVRPAERSRARRNPPICRAQEGGRGNFPARIALKTIDLGKLSGVMGPSLPSAPSTPPSVRRSRPRPPVGRAQKSTRKIYRLATH